MPIYEYHCPSCRTRFELLRPFARADDEAPCPACREASHRGLSLIARGRTGSASGATPSGGCGGCSGGHCASCR